MSAFHLHRPFKKQTGLTPEAFSKSLKAEQAGNAAGGKEMGSGPARGGSLLAEEMVAGVLDALR